MSLQTLHFTVSSWSGWTTDPDPLPAGCDVAAIHRSERPDASAVPAMLRRRLNFMGRACVAEMLKQLDENEDIPVIYCSRHGDVERTLKVLIDQSKGEPTSPMDFSLSVHNAITGVLSIHCGIRENVSSIATDSGAVLPVLLEANGLLAEGNEKVLCLICDVSLPELYRSSAGPVEPPFVACFTLTRKAEGCQLMLRQAITDPSGSDICMDQELQSRHALDFISFLSSPDREFLTRHNGMTWQVIKEF